MLAIVVPAYKPQFFQLALNSIAAQTNNNFECYIFDDAASEEIKSISDDFPNFYYTRFNENMGGRDLVGHWHRCLESVKEEWVWLFSDDDIMAPNCVEEFYRTLNLYPNATAFRFALDIIDASGQITDTNTVKNETGLEFLKSKLIGQVSFLQDHIFNWKKLKDINKGFVKFPLAWCSDDATWCLLGKIHEIIAIPSAVVQWRYSGINICSKKDIETLKIKLYAWMLFYLWCSRNFRLPFSYKLKFVRLFVRFNGTIPFLHFFQPSIFHSPVLILVILLVPIRKLYKMLKWFGKTTKLLTRGK
jgi:glycosyltransferase involved in cell wall biosynthesis